MVRFVEIEVNEKNETSLLIIIKNYGRLCVPTKCVRNSLELHIRSVLFYYTHLFNVIMLWK